MSRESVIESVKTPLGFFVLAILVLEVGLLGSLTVTPQSIHRETLYLFGALSVLLILSVLIVSRRGESGIDVDALGYAIGSEIYYAFDPYISNLPDAERIEAYQSLLVQMKTPSDTRNKLIRTKIAEVIRERAGLSD